MEETSKFHICFHLNAPKSPSKDRKVKGNNIFTESIVRRSKRRGRTRKIENGYESPAENKSDNSLLSLGESEIIFNDLENILFNSDSEDSEQCVYCSKKMPPRLLGEHEDWHRKYDKSVKNLNEVKTERPTADNESLCAFCGLFKPSNKIRRHEYVDHMKRNVRKVCDICGIFTCPTYIKEHMRTHDAVKGFKCDDCGKAFFRRKALSRHRLVHSDVAQWICAVCGKSFKIKFNLRVHMRTHDDIKPFPCSVCKKTFTTKQWRDNHMKTHGILTNR